MTDKSSLVAGLLERVRQVLFDEMSMKETCSNSSCDPRKHFPLPLASQTDPQAPPGTEGPLPLALQEAPGAWRRNGSGALESGCKGSSSSSIFLRCPLSSFSRPLPPHWQGGRQGHGNEKLVRIQYLAQGLAHEGAPSRPTPHILPLAGSRFQSRPQIQQLGEAMPKVFANPGSPRMAAPGARLATNSPVACSSKDG